MLRCSMVLRHLWCLEREQIRRSQPDVTCITDVRRLDRDGTGKVPEAAGASSMMSCRGGSGGGGGSAMVEMIETML